MVAAFPRSQGFTGANEPSRIECDIYDLVIEGALPKEFEGAWYRLTADPQFPPMLGDDVFTSGDGMISVFRFDAGHVDYRSRYVQTERLVRQKAARRSLYGLYNNPFTDDPSVQGTDRGTANTTPVWHGGRLLATKEESLPYEVDPVTLATIGRFTYDDKLRSRVMTSHPRIDFDTGEMFIYAYEATSIASSDMMFGVVNPEGELVSEEFFDIPYPSEAHDFAVTKEHVIFPIFPTVGDLDRLKAGGPHWVWDPARDSHVGIMPRGGSVSEIRWFQGPAASGYHFMNAFTEGSKVYLDFTRGKVNPLEFIRDATGIEATPEDIAGNLVRWTFDLADQRNTWQETVLGPGGDFSRIADKDHMKDYEVGYYQTYIPQNGQPYNSGPVGIGFNTLCRIEVKTGRLTTVSFGQHTTIQEHVHIASATSGHEGYLALVVDRHDRHLSDVVILAAAFIERGPICTIHLPLRLKSGIHGSWVPATELRHLWEAAGLT